MGKNGEKKEEEPTRLDRPKFVAGSHRMTRKFASTSMCSWLLLLLLLLPSTAAADASYSQGEQSDEKWEERKRRQKSQPPHSPSEKTDSVFFSPSWELVSLSYLLYTVQFGPQLLDLASVLNCSVESQFKCIPRTFNQSNLLRNGVEV